MSPDAYVEQFMGGSGFMSRSLTFLNNLVLPSLTQEENLMIIRNKTGRTAATLSGYLIAKKQSASRRAASRVLIKGAFLSADKQKQVLI